MRIYNRCKIFGFTAIVLSLCASYAQAHRNDVLIIPARARLVRLAFDIHALRGPTLISYRATDDPLQPLLHVWNRAQRDWQQVDIAHISRAQNIPARPNRAYIVGLREELPDVIPAALSHAAELRILNTLSVAEILTILDRDMQFNIQEWRALAARYNLEITELNYESRRWGRFGPPRRYRDQTPPEQRQPLTPAPQAPTARENPVAPATVSDNAIETAQDDTLPSHTTDQEALFEYLLEYEPMPLDPVQGPTKMTPHPEKGRQASPTKQKSMESREEDFPIK